MGGTGPPKATDPETMRANNRRSFMDTRGLKVSIRGLADRSKGTPDARMGLNLSLGSGKKVNLRSAQPRLKARYCYGISKKR
jgi:hypothetical protein